MLSGMLVINKEAGFTSSDVVAKLRGILHMRKIGHTGTLDPMATGVLPVCLGNGTKLAELIGDRDKEYIAVMRAGVTTDTQDMTGRVLSRMESDRVRTLISEEKVQEILSGFRGAVSQTVPMYSAVWVNGQRLYNLARAGKCVERPTRTVMIHELELLGTDCSNSADAVRIRIRVVCSKGTYIRTLCEDIGKALGTGAAMESLVRTRVGDFRLDEKALTLSGVQKIMNAHNREQNSTDNTARKDVCYPAELLQYIYPVDSFFQNAPQLFVSPDGLPHLLNGNALNPRDFGSDLNWSLVREEGGKKQAVTAHGSRLETSLFRLYTPEGRFCALYGYNEAEDALLCVKFFPEQRTDRKLSESQE